MTVKLQKRLINVDEYHLMGEIGILEEKGLELIEGEIIIKSRSTSQHASCVSCLNHLLSKAKLVNQLKEEVILSIKNPVTLDEYSETEPDITILKYKLGYYKDAHPTPKDVLLLIEVADSTLVSDREVKATLYAKAGIPEYWIVNLADNQVEVFHSPNADLYQQTSIFGINDEIKTQYSDQITIQVQDILG